jgi:hypothetical protein
MKFLEDLLRPAVREKNFHAQLLAGGLTELLARVQSSTLGDTTTHSTARRPAGCSSSGNFAEEAESLQFGRFGGNAKVILESERARAGERLAAQCCNLLPPRS